MRSLRSPSLAAEEWLTAEEVSSDGSARDLGARSEQGIGTRAVRPSARSPRPSGFEDDQVASGPSVGRRIFGALTRFFIAVLLGVGATLAWQSHGDEAKEMLLARAPSLGWLLSVSVTKSPAAITNSPDLVQQLAPLASNLDAVRRNLELLAARQEQMSQNIAALQAVEQDIKEKLSFPPQPAPAPLAGPIPQRKPPQPRAQSSGVQSESRPPPPAGSQLPSR
jgi:hypothetical protein